MYTKAIYIQSKGYHLREFWAVVYGRRPTGTLTVDAGLVRGRNGTHSAGNRTRDTTYGSPERWCAGAELQES